MLDLLVANGFLFDFWKEKCQLPAGRGRNNLLPFQLFEIEFFQVTDHLKQTKCSLFSKKKEGLLFD